MCMSVSKGGQLWGKMGQGKEGKDFVLFCFVWCGLGCFVLFQTGVLVGFVCWLVGFVVVDGLVCCFFSVCFGLGGFGGSFWGVFGFVFFFVVVLFCFVFVGFFCWLVGLGWFLLFFVRYGLFF